MIAYIERYAITAGNSVPKIKIASLELDIQNHILYQGTQGLKKLSKLEFALLLLLNEHPGEIVSHDEISKLWEEATVDNHSLYNLIAKLRKTLSVDARIEIATASGGDGYMLRIGKNRIRNEA